MTIFRLPILHRKLPEVKLNSGVKWLWHSFITNLFGVTEPRLDNRSHHGSHRAVRRRLLSQVLPEVEQGVQEAGPPVQDLAGQVGGAADNLVSVLENLSNHTILDERMMLAIGYFVSLTSCRSYCCLSRSLSKEKQCSLCIKYSKMDRMTLPLINPKRCKQR